MWELAPLPDLRLQDASDASDRRSAERSRNWQERGITKRERVVGDSLGVGVAEVESGFVGSEKCGGGEPDTGPVARHQAIARVPKQVLVVGDTLGMRVPEVDQPGCLTMESHRIDPVAVEVAGEWLVPRIPEEVRGLGGPRPRRTRAETVYDVNPAF